MGGRSLQRAPNYNEALLTVHIIASNDPHVGMVGVGHDLGIVSTEWLSGTGPVCVCSSEAASAAWLTLASLACYCGLARHHYTGQAGHAGRECRPAYNAGKPQLEQGRREPSRGVQLVILQASSSLCVQAMGTQNQASLTI